MASVTVGAGSCCWRQRSTASSIGWSNLISFLMGYCSGRPGPRGIAKLPDNLRYTLLTVGAFRIYEMAGRTGARNTCPALTTGTTS
jgi:hypothetical protein